MNDAARSHFVGTHNSTRWGREKQLYRKVKTDDFLESDDDDCERENILSINQHNTGNDNRSIMDDQDEHAHMVNFRVIYVTMHLVGIALIVLMCAWVSMFLGGVGVAEPQFEFNWHPVLMTIGMLYLYGNTIVLYRGLRYARKKNLKLAHAGGFICVMVLTVLGLVTVFDSHNYAKPPIPNLYSLHSWIGLAAVILFGLQWCAGFVTFLFPQLRGAYKSAIMPYHIFFGLLGYAMAVVAALLGLSEKAFFHMKNISELPHEGVLVNTIGFLIMVYASLVGFLATKSQYKRKPLPEDAILLTGSEE